MSKKEKTNKQRANPITKNNCSGATKKWYNKNTPKKKSVMYAEDLKANLYDFLKFNCIKIRFYNPLLLWF